MTKPTLKIEKREFGNTGRTRSLGMMEILHYLADSDLFDISFHDDKINTFKGQMGTILYYQDKKIYLDLWEYPTPSYTPQYTQANLDLIIKLQHKVMIMELPILERFCKRKNLLMHLSETERVEYAAKFVPWTFFASRLLLPFAGKEDTIEALPIEHIGFFCGKVWKSRLGMKKHLEECGIEYTKSSQEFRSGRPLTDEEYLRKMKTSKYGIVLHGRGSMFTEAKNRREIDYMMLKKPLLLNYKPYYYDPLIDGKHYIYIDEKTDFENLDKLYNIDDIAKNGYEWYQKNASPMSVAESFLRIMNDKFGK